MSSPRTLQHDLLHRGGRRLVPLAAAALALGALSPALAVDGVIEINQAKAIAGGVTPADAPGFPIVIDEPGSYRLTGDLDAGPGIGGFEITAADVTLDLNGFNLIGGGEVGSANGIHLLEASNVEIRNGTVRGFLGRGILGSFDSPYARVIRVRALGNFNSGIVVRGAGSLVDGCTAIGNGNTGVLAWNGSLIIDSVARDNVNHGLDLAVPGGYRSNVLSDNNGGGAQVLGGIELGANYCQGNLICP